MPPRPRREEILETAATILASSGARASVKDIADACGILPGSLYHHFESKEALLAELVRRYREDLDRVARDALISLDRSGGRNVERLVVDLGRAIASCAVTHRAAVLTTVLEPAATASGDFARLAGQKPVRIHDAMRAVLEAGRSAGAVREGIDLSLLADRLCQSLLRHAVGESYLLPDADQIPELRCRILLEGLAADRVSSRRLDRSEALASARRIIARWHDDSDEDAWAARLRAVARAEFVRRGYGATTMRQIAAAAHTTSANVYRFFESKEALLLAVLRAYNEQRSVAWAAVLQAGSSPLEKLDALTWVNINLLDRFMDEFRIRLGWVRESPPNVRKLGSTAEQREGIRALLVAGARSGELCFEHGALETRARCIYEAMWIPESIIQAGGPERAHALARETFLQGALVRS